MQFLGFGDDRFDLALIERVLDGGKALCLFGRLRMDGYDLDECTMVVIQEHPFEQSFEVIGLELFT